MFVIRSYLKKPEIKITNLEDLNNNYSKYFVEISDEEIIKNLAIDLNYVEGAIYLSYYDTELLNFTCWDLIDQLWAYLLNMVNDLVNGANEVQTFFPDQPIEITITKLSDEFLLLTIQKEKTLKVNIPSDKFYPLIIDNALIFYSCMTKCFNMRVDYSNQLELIDKLTSFDKVKSNK